MGITSTELARLCNVSRATVDRVFNNRGRVNEETRRRILETAKAAGYRPNPIAQSLATGRSSSIGFAVPSLSNQFFSILVNSATRRAQENGYITLVTLYEDDPRMEKECLASLIERRVDGLIVFSTSKGGETAAQLALHQVPAVAILNEIQGIPYVGIDFCRAMFDAASHAVAMGFQNLVFLCPPLLYESDRNIDAVRKKHLGFLKALSYHPRIHGSVLTSLDTLCAQASDGFPPKTAVLCASDIYALEAFRFFKANGIHMPEDIGLMGFDGLAYLEDLEPSISTVSVPISEIGETAVQALTELIKTGTCSPRTELPHTIRAGESIG